MSSSAAVNCTLVENKLYIAPISYLSITTQLTDIDCARLPVYGSTVA